MPVETRILDAIEGDIRCNWCGRFVRIGEGTTLGYWTTRGTFILLCHQCELKPETIETIREFKQERV